MEISNEFKAVVFQDWRNQFYEVVAVEDAFEFNDKHRGTHQLLGALTRTGRHRFTYAKAWFCVKTGQTVRIGAGAYGDTLIAKRV